MAQLNIAEQNWSPGQPSFLQPRELRGMPNHIHMGAGPPPQFNRMEEMGVQGGRAKRYSSQRQRPVPEPPPLQCISVSWRDITMIHCSSRDQSIPMVTALPHCLHRACLCSQKCTFPTQVYIPTRHQLLCPIQASIPHQCPCLQDSHHLSSCLLLLTFLLQAS